jgi:DNA repair protein RecO (recombination protein O)
MLIKTRGIVLHTLKYAETSVICKIYTEEQGLQSYIVSGVRAVKSSKLALLQPMMLLEMVVYHQNSKELHRTKEIRPAYIYASLPFTLPKTAVGLFCIELVQKTLIEAEANPRIFDFLSNFYTTLDQTNANVSNWQLYFAIKWAGLLGFAPQGKPSPTTPYFDLQEGVFSPIISSEELSLSISQSELLYYIYNAETPYFAPNPVSKTERNLLLEAIIRYLQLHLELKIELHTWQIYKEIFNR